jgi:hypothetical protein
MKKLLVLLVSVSMLLLSACGGSNSGNTESNVSKEAGGTVSEENPAPTQEAEDEKQTVEVDKGLFSNEITLPAHMFEGQDLDQVIAQAKEDGVGEVKKNEDGSLTYKMTKSAYNDMMKKMEQGVLEYLDELKSGVDFPSIKDVTHNKSFSEFTLIVDREAYESGFDGMSSFGLVILATYYQLFDGVSSDDMKITVHVQDEATKEVFSTKDYPEAFEQ